MGKPHAVTNKVEAMVLETLQKSGFTITADATLNGKTIEEKQYIDNHYYAIANKASLSKPADLNPPAAKQDEFKTNFGLSWADALAQGLAYNAVDGCSKLGVNGDELNTMWAAAKKAGKLVKFGGGFYAGELPLPSEEVASPAQKKVAEDPSPAEKKAPASSSYICALVSGALVVA